MLPYPQLPPLHGGCHIPAALHAGLTNPCHLSLSSPTLHLQSCPDRCTWQRQAQTAFGDSSLDHQVSHQDVPGAHRQRSRLSSQERGSSDRVGQSLSGRLEGGRRRGRRSPSNLSSRRGRPILGSLSRCPALGGGGSHSQPHLAEPLMGHLVWPEPQGCLEPSRWKGDTLSKGTTAHKHEPTPGNTKSVGLGHALPASLAQNRTARHTQPEPTQVTPLPPSAGACDKRKRKGAICPSKEPLPGPRMQVTFPNPLAPTMSAQWPRAPTAHTGSTPTLYSHTYSARGQEQYGPTHR